MKTLQTTIGGFMLAAHYCATEAEIDSALCDEILGFTITHKWDEVQQLRDVGAVEAGYVDPRFPSYDVDDAINTWEYLTGI